MSDTPTRMDRDKATDTVREVLSWYAYLDNMPADARERLVRDLVRKMDHAWSNGDTNGFSRACDKWAASLEGKRQ